MTTWRADVTCWDPESAERLIPIEAEALPDDLFQATHVPLRLRRVSPVEPDTMAGEEVSEEQVLSYLLHTLQPGARRTDILPILGASGAGKSHLVRWVRNELRQQPQLTDLRVVFIPKHRTSLRGVIASIVSAFDDLPDIASLRDRLLAAREDTASPAALRTRVRDALCYGLEYHADRTETSDGLEEDACRYLSSALPAILRDPHFAPRYLEPDGAIARLVEEKQSGRRGDDALEHAFRFSATDVAVSVDDVTRAAMTSQEVANQLAADPEITPSFTLREVAARMLNDQLPGAIKEVFGIGGEDLRELFTEVRRLLAGKQDIVLLVEDFAMFQGLQTGLIDAITVSSSVTEPLCHLVTVVAVTTGYYTDELPDTLKTRASAAFVVDEQGADAPLRFASRYLRAIRLQSTDRSVSSDERSCDGCPVMSECHDAFGSRDGEGLFPFNEVLLKRGVQTRLAGRFIARGFLTQLLRPLLVDEHDRIRSAEHPSAELAERFGARRFEPTGDVLMRLRSRDQGERRVRLALLYKDPVDDGDHRSAVHAAFGLPELGILAQQLCSTKGCDRPASADGRCDQHVGSTSRRPAKTGPEVDPKPKPPPSVPPLVEAIDRWKRGSTPSQRERRALRKLVTEAVAARLELNDGAFRRAAWDKKDVAPRMDLEGSGQSIVLDGNRPQGADWVMLELSSQEPDTIDAIQTLAWLGDRRSWREIPNGVERAARLDLMLERWSKDIAQQLGLRQPPDDELALAAHALEVLAGLAGQGPVPRRSADRLVRLRRDLSFDPTGWPASLRIPKNLEVHARNLRLLLDRRLAYAQGTGSPVAYDAVNVRRLFERMRSADLNAAEDHPAGDAISVVAKLAAAVDGSRQELLSSIPDISLLGGEQPAQLQEDLDRLAQRGQVSAERRRALTEASRAVRPDDVDAVEQARAKLERFNELSIADRCALATGDWRVAAQRLRRFLDLALTTLDAATPAGMSIDSSARARVSSDWASKLGEVGASVSALSKELR